MVAGSRRPDAPLLPSSGDSSHMAVASRSCRFRLRTDLARPSHVSSGSSSRYPNMRRRRTRGAEPVIERPIMTRLLNTPLLHPFITVWASLSRAGLLWLVVVGAAAANDGGLASALQAAQCPLGRVEQIYKSMTMQVYKVDCKDRRDGQLIVTCTRTGCRPSDGPTSAEENASGP